MSTRRIQFIMSIVFVIGYFFLLAIIIFIESSDSMNMKKGDNSMMGEFKILIGVMTGAVAQVLNFWFNKVGNEGATTVPVAPIASEPTPVLAPADPIVSPVANPGNEA